MLRFSMRLSRSPQQESCVPGVTPEPDGEEIAEDGNRPDRPIDEETQDLRKDSRYIFLIWILGRRKDRILTRSGGSGTGQEDHARRRPCETNRAAILRSLICGRGTAPGRASRRRSTLFRRPDPETHGTERLAAEKTPGTFSFPSACSIAMPNPNSSRNSRLCGGQGRDVVDLTLHVSRSLPQVYRALSIQPELGAVAK